MAFHSSSVNEHLRFDRKIKLIITDIAKSSIMFNFSLNVGVLENTKIIWNPRTDADINLFK